MPDWWCAASGSRTCSPRTWAEPPRPGGLDALAVICAGAPAHLAAGGALIVEHGATQGPGVRELMARAGLAGVATHADLAGRPRATRGNSPRPALESAFDAREWPR